MRLEFTLHKDQNLAGSGPQRCTKTKTLRCTPGLVFIGDALGVPYEFMGRGSFTCSGMAGHGTHDQPAGTWSDDTSMALAVCDSYRELGRIHVGDIRKKFLAWYNDDAYTCDRLFDIGNATATALRVGHGLTGERDNGNGSLMRTVSLTFMDAADDEVRAVAGPQSLRLRTRTDEERTGRHLVERPRPRRPGLPKHGAGYSSKAHFQAGMISMLPSSVFSAPSSRSVITVP